MIDTPLYDFEVAWSEPDRLYVATLTDLRGNVARSTIRAATLAALTSAIGLWIEQAEILGSALPESAARPAGGATASSIVCLSPASGSDDARRKAANLGEDTAGLSAADAAVRAHQLAKAA